MTELDSWLSFWNAPNKIYVNQRHQEAHYDRLFASVRPFLPNTPKATMLDWGCGTALAAKRMSAICDTILLYDAAETVRTRLRATFYGQARIHVIDDAYLAKLPAGSVDFILVNSVVQYLAQQELTDALEMFARLLRPQGVFLLGDVIEPGTPMLGDARNLLRFAISNGFVAPALFAMLGTLVSPHRRLRKKRGFACYSPKEMLTFLGKLGFQTELLPANIVRADIAAPTSVASPRKITRLALARTALL